MESVARVVSGLPVVVRAAHVHRTSCRSQSMRPTIGVRGRVGGGAFGSRRPGKLGAMGTTPSRGGGRKLATHVVNTATFDQMEPEEPMEASDAMASADTTASKVVKRSALVITVMSLVWYAGNIYFNILNKQVLKAFMFPFTCTCIYLGVCGLVGVAGWVTGLLEKPKLTQKQFVAFVPMAILHLLANVLIMVSLGNVPVSFTHTIKACEPFVLVVTSAVILGTRPSALLVASLVPVVVGVSVASATELCFNWIGFASAMASNLASALRNTYSKACLGDARGDLSSVNLLAILSMMASVMMIPLTLALEGNALAAPALAAKGLQLWPVVQNILVAGLTMTLYQQVSYNVLSKVSPVTHSVMNCLKRIAVIVASVLVFRNPISFGNGMGTAIAIGGVLLYSFVKRYERQQKDEAAAAAQ